MVAAGFDTAVLFGAEVDFGACASRKALVNMQRAAATAHNTTTFEYRFIAGQTPSIGYQTRGHHTTPESDVKQRHVSVMSPIVP